MDVRNSHLLGYDECGSHQSFCTAHHKAALLGEDYPWPALWAYTTSDGARAGYALRYYSQDATASAPTHCRPGRPQYACCSTRRPSHLARRGRAFLAKTHLARV